MRQTAMSIPAATIRPQAGHDFRTGRWVAVIFMTALTIRLVYLTAMLHLNAPILMEYDDGQYHVMARSIAMGHGMGDGHGPSAAKSPGYPWFLGGLYAAFGPRAVPPRLLQAILGAATAALVAPLALELGLGFSTAVAAGLAAAVYPPAIYFTGRYFPTVLHAFLLVVSVFALLRWARGGAWDLGVASFGLGLAALVRSDTLILIPLLAVSTFTICRGRRALVGATAILAVTTLMYAPWVIRNQHVFGHPIVSTSQARLTCWEGNNPWARGGYVLETDVLSRYAGAPIPLHMPADQREQLEGLRRIEGAQRMWTEAQRDSAYGALVDQWIRRDPAAYGRNLLRKLVVFFSPWWPGQGGVVMWRYRYVILVSAGLVLVFAPIGFVTGGRRGPGRWVVFAVLLQSIATALVAFGHARYRFAFEVLATPYAAYGVGWLLRAFRSWRGRLDRGAPATHPGRP